MNKRNRSGDAVPERSEPAQRWRTAIVPLILLTIAVPLLTAVYSASYRARVDAIQADHDDYLPQLVLGVRGRLAQARAVLALAAGDPLLLAAARDGAVETAARQRLDELVTASQAGALHLFSADGEQIASTVPSARFAAVAELARALELESGGDFVAAGSSGSLAYISAQPLTSDGLRIGTLVAETHLESLDLPWPPGEAVVVITDSDSRVVASNRYPLRGRRLLHEEEAPKDAAGMPPPTLLQTLHQREAGAVEVEVEVNAPNRPDGVTSLHERVLRPASRYLELKTPIAPFPLQAYLLLPLQPAVNAARIETAAWALAIALLYLFASALRQRQAYLRQRHQLKSQAVSELRLREAQARSLIEHTQAALLITDAQGKVEFLNPSARQTFDLVDGSAEPLWIRDLLTPETHAEVASLLARAQAGLGTVDSSSLMRSLRGRRRSGATFPLDVAVGYVKVLDEPRFLITLFDRTDEERTYEKLQIAAEVVDHALEGIVVTRPDATIVSVNPAFTAITQFRPDEIVGQNPRLLKSSRQSQGFYRAMWNALLEEGQWQGEIWNRRKDGSVYAEQLSITAIRDRRGSLSGYVGIFSDITQRKKMEEKLWHLAHRDALTGLASRTLLMDRLGQALAQANRTHLPLAVVFIDLDGFKQVNDEQGHEAGDTVLKTIAQRLNTCLREGDTAARLGGDEFILILHMLAASDAYEKVARRVLSLLSSPIEIDGRSWAVSGSVGIALHPEHGEEAEDLIQKADAAMYAAKRSGKNRFCLYTPSSAGAVETGEQDEPEDSGDGGRRT